MALSLIMSGLYNALLSIFLYILDKKTVFSKIPYKAKQFVIGMLFGFMAIFSTTTLGGFDIGDGTIMNVRDAAPLCAGLIFGAPAGIIAGLIGGIYRFVAVYFGLAGTYTQIACSLSTILAGFIGAILRKFMFDDKKTTWLYGLGIGMVTEVLHMLMIFFTNMNDAVNAFEFVKICTLPMVIGNGLAVGIAVFIVSVIGKEKFVIAIERICRHSIFAQVDSRTHDGVDCELALDGVGCAIDEWGSDDCASLDGE